MRRKSLGLPDLVIPPKKLDDFIYNLIRFASEIDLTGYHQTIKNEIKEILNYSHEEEGYILTEKKYLQIIKMVSEFEISEAMMQLVKEGKLEMAVNKNGEIKIKAIKN